MSTTRPPLPRQFWNPHLKNVLENAVLPQVKYQVLSCQGQDILVGRLKIETPTASGHAFILRRYDTGAVSLTTMFRAAFPNAPEQDEKMEVQWVKDNHNLAGNNGSSREPHITRLAGTWIDTDLALELGKAYELGALIQRVIDSEPDPTANYRRPAKAAAQKDDAAPSAAAKPPSKSLPTPSPTSVTANPSKRRKESSPAPPTPKPQPPRRSTRTKSPPPKSKPPSSIMAAVAKPKKSTRRDSVAEPTDPDSQTVEDVAGTELFEQDLAEQKEMIEDLKAQRDVVKRSTASPDKKGKAAKRTREDEEAKLQFEFKEPEVGERAIVTNKRVGLFREMEPRRKSAAWGLGLFVFGAGAVSLLPNFF